MSDIPLTSQLSGFCIYLDLGQKTCNDMPMQFKRVCYVIMDQTGYHLTLVLLDMVLFSPWQIKDIS